MNLVQQLFKKGLIDKERATSLEYEIKTSGQKEESVLLEKGVVTEQVLFGLKSENLKIPLKEVVIEDVSLKVLEAIPEESAKFYKMIPFARRDNVLDIGMVYPEDLGAQEALKFLSRQGKWSCEVFLITPSVFNNLLRKYKTLKGEVGQALEELQTELKEDKARTSAGASEFERLAEEAPITKVVAVMLRHAVDGLASDIHIEPTRDKLRIRFRMDGELHSSIILPRKIAPAVVARIKILSNLKLDETRVPQDGRFSARINDKEIDFRVSIFPTTLGEKAVLRILDPTTGLKDFTDLGLTGVNLEKMKLALEKPFGLILSTGPTGSGKSTTLYAAMKVLNKENVNIVTLEDPVEYSLEGINQSQVRPEINYGFARGLRHVLRQDPDIIMVGEIRDSITANLAIHASLTGHLVLSTLHTNNAIGVIPRLIDMGIRPFLLPPTLSLAIAQRLVRTICPFCKKEVKPSKEMKDIIVAEINSLPSSVKEKTKISPTFSLYESQGCKKCNFKGLTGRIGIFETLLMTDSLARIILKDPSEEKIRQEADSQGMITMKQDGILKALEGFTTIEEVLRVTEED